MLTRLARFVLDRSGAVAPAFAIALVALVGAGALAWDVSRAYALRGELDSAVDAAALAGATQLDGTAGARTRATTAARGALVKNGQRLADTADADSADTATVVFLQDLVGRQPATTDADARFIQVDITPTTLSPVMGAIVSAGAFQAQARAVAGYTQALCRAPPIYVCSPNGQAFDPNAYTGRAVSLQDPNAGNGNWGFIDVGNGASDVGPAMGAGAPTTECISLSPLPQPGNVTSADDYFNTRFDIYRGPASTLDNDANFAPSLNTIIGAATNDNGKAVCTPNVPAIRNTCAGTNTVYADGMGMPIDCGQSVATSGFGSGVWNFKQYFLNNHNGPGAPADPSTYTPAGGGWTAYGPAGVTTPTRYQVYNWELAMLANTIAKPAWAFSSGQTDSSGKKDYAAPKCNKTNSVQQSPDRRAITAAIAICPVNGRNPVQIIGFIDLFLLHPAANQEIFAEIIGASSEASSPGKDSLAHRVVLYE